MSYKYLSYPLTKNTPLYGGNDRIVIERDKAIIKGDSANTYRFSIKNHCGTHIDAPNHFFEKGPKITDYPPQFWFFKSPCVVKINLKPLEILKCGKWLKNIKHNNDILLINSGWTKQRKKKIYIFKNPGIHADVALFLRKECPNLRAIGIDWISISSYKNRELGRNAHKAFLDHKGINNPILIVEDMNLSYDLSALKELIILPLFVDKIDSAPCTIIGKFS